MPHLNGIEAAKEILRYGPSTISLSDRLHHVSLFAGILLRYRYQRFRLLAPHGTRFDAHGGSHFEKGKLVSRTPFKDNSSPLEFLKRAPEITNVFIEFLWNLSISRCGCVKSLGLWGSRNAHCASVRSMHPIYAVSHNSHPSNGLHVLHETTSSK